MLFLAAKVHTVARSTKVSVLLYYENCKKYWDCITDDLSYDVNILKAFHEHSKQGMVNLSKKNKFFGMDTKYCSS